MRLIIGEHAGFCFGVKRAVERACGYAEQALPCATLGPLIHNPQEVERLSRAGIRCVSTPAEVSPGETLLIRSHGVSPAVMRQASKKGVPVIDLTCPHVAHIHRLVSEAEDGRTVIIVGEADHPEVQGIAGWAKGQPVILPTAEAAMQAVLPQKAMVVAQTTLRRETFESVLSVLSERIPDLQVHRTICAATSQRQEEAARLSMEADAVVVVGGRNSSNTKKLYETCLTHCARTILAETPEDIPTGFFTEQDTVAVTAGASTPQWLLQAVCDRIRGGKP